MPLDACSRPLSRHVRLTGLVLLACAALFAASAVFAERADAAEVKFGIVTGTIYFSKGETSNVAIGGGFANLACSQVPPPGNAICSAAVATWMAQAARAKEKGMCLKVKFTQAPPPAFQHWPDIYGGGYCN